MLLSNKMLIRRNFVLVLILIVGFIIPTVDGISVVNPSNEAEKLAQYTEELLLNRIDKTLSIQEQSIN